MKQSIIKCVCGTSNLPFQEKICPFANSEPDFISFVQRKQKKVNKVGGSLAFLQTEKHSSSSLEFGNWVWQ